MYVGVPHLFLVQFVGHHVSAETQTPGLSLSKEQPLLLTDKPWPQEAGLKEGERAH